MKFAFAGTPLFGAWVLRDLVELGCPPALVISQPDRPQGRGRKGAPPPTVTHAGLLGLESLQTEDINSPIVLEHLRKLEVSTLVVAAFGQLLTRSLLESMTCINVHASLLPKYRGAAPIERALAAGEASTGVSIMRMTEGLDEGPWAQQTSVSVGLRDDAGSVGRVLALLGAVAVVQVADALADGTVEWREQVGPSSHATRIEARDCLIDTTISARVVHDRVRALSPWIGARAASGEVRYKIWRTWPYGQPGLPAVPDAAQSAAGCAGRLLVVGDRLFLGCADGVVEVLEVQPVNRPRMTAAAFIRGYAGRLGAWLGPVEPADRSECG